MTRIFPFANTPNFRELGGYPTSDQRQIRWHRLLRAGYLTNLTTEELQFLQKYGLRYSFDLRSPYERKNWPDPDVPFLKVIACQLVQETPIGDLVYQTLPQTDQFNGLPGIYQRVVLDHSAQRVFRQFFQLLLQNDQEQEAVVFHCTAGKDRTGILAILLLLILQVPVEYIAQDYLLTNLMYQNAQDLTYLDNADNEHQQTINFTKADKAAVLAIKVAIERIYGSLSKFQSSVLRLTPKQQQHLRDIYTEPCKKA
ncbi:tyrosine-protein phosphatase [Bombilactobacillus thymidiniphilus]|uniref:Tyrosine-protein phosphatase n=1 Tax=Bombilactobacillus thymidiniphilus TaxID=2923363 RepID=A0ABY4PCN9_9LACO|nr:tyrosine-protein phosphatase [Bombilactobacillus thymidiniphilus]UQS83037.1 tyrosine-protein phosphatase [Bombilactobacillus thymidiniphilus]